MTLIPALIDVDRLAVSDPSIYVDEITEAILNLKRHPDDDEALSAVRAYSFLDVDLVCIGAQRARNGHTTLSYAVEDYRQGGEALRDALAPEIHLFGKIYRPAVPNSIQLYRRSHVNGGSGKWWSLKRFDAMREGVAHEDPVMFTAMVPTTNIIMRTRTRFDKGGTSPAEFVIDTTGLDITELAP